MPSSCDSFLQEIVELKCNTERHLKVKSYPLNDKKSFRSSILLLSYIIVSILLQGFRDTKTFLGRRIVDAIDCRKSVQEVTTLSLYCQMRKQEFEADLQFSGAQIRQLQGFLPHLLFQRMLCSKPDS